MLVLYYVFLNTSPNVFLEVNEFEITTSVCSPSLDPYCFIHRISSGVTPPSTTRQMTLHWLGFQSAKPLVKPDNIPVMKLPRDPELDTSMLFLMTSEVMLNTSHNRVMLLTWHRHLRLLYPKWKKSETANHRDFQTLDIWNHNSIALHSRKS